MEEFQQQPQELADVLSRDPAGKEQEEECLIGLLQGIVLENSCGRCDKHRRKTWNARIWCRSSVKLKPRMNPNQHKNNDSCGTLNFTTVTSPSKKNCTFPKAVRKHVLHEYRGSLLLAKKQTF